MNDVTDKKISNIRTISDLAQSVAAHRLRGLDLGRVARKLIPGIEAGEDGVAPEHKAEFKAGAVLQFCALPSRAATLYRETDGKLEKVGPVAAGHKPGNGEMLITAAYATGLSTVEFTRIKRERPSEGAALGEIRKAAQDHAAGAWRNLLTYVRAAMNAERGGRARTETKGWTDAAGEMLDTLVKRAKSARAKGMDAPDDAKVAAAIKAFWAALK